MSGFRDSALKKILTMAPRYLPFADVATEAVPLSRLIRLSLFQVTVGIGAYATDRHAEPRDDRRIVRGCDCCRGHDRAARFGGPFPSLAGLPF